MDKLKEFCNKGGIKSIIITVIVTIITVSSLLSYVSNEIGGNITWLIMPSSYFGVPSELNDEVETLCDNGALGWDGQFYYYISNDILGLKDTAQHIDAPSYRYQRIGLPLIVRIVSWVFGQKNVSVWMFTLIYILILVLATYIFARFLEKRGHSILWILPWILSVGVQITLRHALPDGAADAFMLMAIILLLDEKYIGYSLAITIASLCREANISIAAMIFVFGFFGLLKREKKFDIKFASILALPGIVFVLWYLYVTVHFGAFPFSQAIGINEFFMKGFIDYFIIAVTEHEKYKIVGLVVYAVSVFLALILEIIRGKKNHIWWSLVPFTILVGSFGPTVMSHYSGYLKGISSLFIYIPIMFLEENSLLEKIETEKIYSIEKIAVASFMTIVLATGLWAVSNHAQGLLLAKYALPDRNDDAIALIDFSSNVLLNENKGAIWVDMPYSNLYNAENKYTIMSVHLDNLSNETWSYAPNSSGANAVYVSYHWFKAGDMNNVVKDGVRNSLRRDVQPGESVDVDMYVEFPDKPGQYVLRITLLQEGVAWFYTQEQGYVDVNYVIE